MLMNPESLSAYLKTVDLGMGGASLSLCADSRWWPAARIPWERFRSTRCCRARISLCRRLYMLAGMNDFFPITIVGEMLPLRFTRLRPGFQFRVALLHVHTMQTMLTLACV